MKLFDKILLAVDFSESSDIAVGSILPIAKRFKSEIILVHSINFMPTTLHGYKEVTAKIQVAMKNLQSKIIDQGLKCSKEYVLEFASPCDLILATAARYSANLIVMGTGRGSLTDRLALGSTVERVMSRAICPVWAVKPSKQPIDAVSILCATDFSDSSSRAMKIAIELCRLLKARLFVLHIIPIMTEFPFNMHTEGFPVLELSALDYENLSFPPEGMIGIEYHENEETIFLKTKIAYETQKKRLDQYVGKFQMDGLKVTVLIQSGSIEIGILNFIREHNIDLLVIGAIGQTGVSRLSLGSAAEKTVRQAPCSMLITRSNDLLYKKTLTHNDKYKLGKWFLQARLYSNSIGLFQNCKTNNPEFVLAYEAEAQAWDGLGKHQKAKQCRKLGKTKHNEWIERRLKKLER